MFKMNKTLKRIDAYYKECFDSSNPSHSEDKDFYNLLTGKVTCGTCYKEFGSLRFIFHFHLSSRFIKIPKDFFKNLDWKVEISPFGDKKCCCGHMKCINSDCIRFSLEHGII